MQILKRLDQMTTEEGVAMMKQLFNPLRGYHVGYIGESRRGKVREVVEEEQNKTEKESLRRTPRQMDLFADGTLVHSRVQEEKGRCPQASTDNRNKRTEGTRI